MFSISGDTAFLQNLKLKMRKSQLKAFIKGTFSNYIRHCKEYMNFCDISGFNYFPLEPEKSALFVTFLDNGNRNADTIRGYHSSVRTMARMLGVKVPKKEFNEVHLVIKGL